MPIKIKIPLHKIKFHAREYIKIFEVKNSEETDYFCISTVA